jgi:hypothetical protein
MSDLANSCTRVIPNGHLFSALQCKWTIAASAGSRRTKRFSMPKKASPIRFSTYHLHCSIYLKKILLKFFFFFQTNYSFVRSSIHLFGRFRVLSILSSSCGGVWRENFQVLDTVLLPRDIQGNHLTERIGRALRWPEVLDPVVATVRLPKPNQQCREIQGSLALVSPILESYITAQHGLLHG